VVAILVAVPAGAATTGWTIMPAQPAADPFDLTSVDSATTASGVAVGTRISAGHKGVAMRYDGANWAFVPVPQPAADVVLSSVSAPGATDAWAVGSDGAQSGFYSGTRPLALHWDGSTWTVRSPALSVRSMFAAVSAPSAGSVWAVGRIGTDSLVEHWAGSTWTRVSVPDPDPAQPRLVDSLTAVSARTTGEVWAAGTGATGPFSLHRNGSTWTVVPFAKPGGTGFTVTGIVAVGANEAWAVGWRTTASGTTTPLTEHWTGTAWHVVTSVSGAGMLSGVAARGPKDVWAVGSSSGTSGSRSLSLHWDGTAWSKVPAPPASGSGQLFAVATRAGAGRVLATGGDGTGFSFVLSHP
jgi:hypothetical protein